MMSKKQQNSLNGTIKKQQDPVFSTTTSRVNPTTEPLPIPQPLDTATQALQAYVTSLEHVARVGHEIEELEQAIEDKKADRRRLHRDSQVFLQRLQQAQQAERAAG